MGRAAASLPGTTNATNVDTYGDEFMQKWQFPNCIGAVDGKHIRI